MAEKQYKNYDERFLKEESSGSRPIISYTTEELEECSFEQGSSIALKLKKSNGEFVLNKDELRSMFLSGFFVDLSNTEMSTIYSPMRFILNSISSKKLVITIVAGIILYEDSAGNSVTAMDALSFEQLKQSQS